MKNLFGGCKLFQLPHLAYCQMMSYVFEDTSGNLIVIDGGNFAEAEYLQDFIINRGGKVQMWLITHAHSDHIDALTQIIKNQKITIENIYFNFPSTRWLYAAEPSSEESTNDFLNTIKQYNLKVTTTKKGDCYKLGDFKILVLNDPDENINDKVINNSTVVFRITTLNKDVLFLGDLEIEVGQKLVKEYGNKLKCEIVQMAHHGQHGVNEEFYKVVSPKICLWSTPEWLYENDNGGGYNSGEWETLQTRKWMENLNVKENYVSKNTLNIIE